MLRIYKSVIELYSDEQESATTDPCDVRCYRIEKRQMRDDCKDLERQEGLINLVQLGIIPLDEVIKRP